MSSYVSVCMFACTLYGVCRFRVHTRIVACVYSYVFVHIRLFQSMYSLNMCVVSFTCVCFVFVCISDPSRSFV